MAITVDLDKAREILEQVWRERNQAQSLENWILTGIRKILSATDVTFKYILVTGVLGKCSNKNVHPRALQARSTLQGAYDARSLCHNVVVPFEKSKGNLWGLSNEPFLNKPARHPEHSKDNPLRNRKLAKILHDVLEIVNGYNNENCLNVLRIILKLSAEAARERPIATVQENVNHMKIRRFVDRMLEQNMEGSNLVSLVGALLREFTSSDFNILIHPTTNPDVFSGTAGDIEIFFNNTIIAAFECKQRPLTKDDVEHGIKKAIEHKVPEYWFLTLTIHNEHREQIRLLLEKYSGVLDIQLFEFKVIADSWLALLNPIRRGRLTSLIVEIMSKDLRRRQYAQKLVSIWELCTSNVK